MSTVEDQDIVKRKMLKLYEKKDLSLGELTTLLSLFNIKKNVERAAK